MKCRPHQVRLWRAACCEAANASTVIRGLPARGLPTELEVRSGAALLRSLSTMCLVAAVAFAIVGCAAAQSEEEDHAHHHTPEHKPADFPSAVSILHLRRTRLLAPKTGTDPEQFAIKREEYLDIVRWLPELAGDSDMSESSWNVVDAASRELLEIYKPAANAATGSETRLNERGQAAAVEAALRRLEELK